MFDHEVYFSFIGETWQDADYLARYAAEACRRAKVDPDGDAGRVICEIITEGYLRGGYRARRGKY